MFELVWFCALISEDDLDGSTVVRINDASFNQKFDLCDTASGMELAIISFRDSHCDAGVDEMLFSRLKSESFSRGKVISCSRGGLALRKGCC